MELKRIYLDYAASTPLALEVRQAMEKVAALGNPSSIHTEGLLLRKQVDTARDRVARLLEVPSSELYFTSGATESISLAVLGYIRAVRKAVGNDKELHVLMSCIEHGAMRTAIF